MKSKIRECVKKSRIIDKKAKDGLVFGVWLSSINDSNVVKSNINDAMLSKYMGRKLSEDIYIYKLEPSFMKFGFHVIIKSL